MLGFVTWAVAVTSAVTVENNIVGSNAGSYVQVTGNWEGLEYERGFELWCGLCSIGNLWFFAYPRLRRVENKVSDQNCCTVICLREHPLARRFIISY